jgi:uncharacterized protein (UPF0332 family)
LKPETAAFLGKSRACLAKADGMLDSWPDEAGRAAYLAGLHAAQALIVEITGKSIRSHRGVQRELGRLTKDDPSFDLNMRAFLGRTYNLKAIADYETGANSEVSRDSALEAIEESKRFVERLREMVDVG